MAARHQVLLCGPVRKSLCSGRPRAGWLPLSTKAAVAVGAGAVCVWGGGAGTGDERQNRAAANENHPGEGYN